MAAAKALSAAVIDLALDKIMTGTTVVYTNLTTNPTTVAAANAAALLTRTGLTGASFTKTSGSSVQVNAAGTPIAASAGGTISCVVLHDGTNILAITTANTVVQSGQSYTPAAFTITFPAAV